MFRADVVIRAVFGMVAWGTVVTCSFLNCIGDLRLLVLGSSESRAVGILQYPGHPNSPK